MKIKKLWEMLLTVSIYIAILAAIIYCCRMDWIHYGRLTAEWWDWIFKLLKAIMGSLGFCYDRGQEILDKNTGVLLSVLSLIFTAGIHISNRNENKVFGIPRSELECSPLRKLYQKIKWVTFLFPGAMLICVNLGLCITGYLILFYNFMFLLAEYLMLMRSYRKDREKDAVVSHLLGKVEENAYQNENHLLRFRIVLSDIQRSFQEKESWNQAELLWGTFLNRTAAYDERKCFVLNYYYFREIFCAGDEERRFRALKIYFSELYWKNESNDNNIIILWSVIFAAVKDWDIDILNSFLEWFLDFSARSIFIVTSSRSDIHKAQRIQAGFLILVIEYYVKDLTEIPPLFRKNLTTLWQYGYSIFDNKNNDILQCCRMCCEEYLRYENVRISHELDILKADYPKNKGRSFIGRNDILRRENR